MRFGDIPRVVICSLVLLIGFYFVGIPGFKAALPYSNNFRVKYDPQSSHTLRSTSGGIQMSVRTMKWHPLEQDAFPTPVLKNGHQIAKDEAFLNGVKDMWIEEHSDTVSTEFAPFEYKSEEGGQTTTLYGHLFRRKKRDDTISKDLPIVLFFHTGAGPQDVFLFYKADILLQSIDCVILLCDIISDQTGWAWGPNRDKYNEVRVALTSNKGELLKTRVSSAISGILSARLDVNPHKIGALGWCMGGQPILELASIQSTSSYTVQAMISFHGVFARQPPIDIPPISKEEGAGDTIPKMLICNGQEDPFVSTEDIAHAETYFKAHGFSVELFQAEGAKHGFTNKAQDFNGNTAFGYNKAGAQAAWTKTLEVFETTLA